MVYSFYSSIRSGRSTGAPKVVDLVQLRYRDDIEYKLRHTDEEWSKLSHCIDTTIIFFANGAHFVLVTTSNFEKQVGRSPKSEECVSRRIPYFL